MKIDSYDGFIEGLLAIFLFTKINNLQLDWANYCLLFFKKLALVYSFGSV